MKKIILWLIVVVSALLLLGAGIVGANYFSTSLKSQSGQGKNVENTGETITVLNWNIGYAGLGHDSDFITDGGKNLYPPSKQSVETNLKGIQNLIAAHPANIHLFQEVSEPDMLTLGVDVLDGLRSVLPNQDWYFTNDISTRFIPQKNAMHHGLAIFSGIKTLPTKTIRLPLEPTRLNGILKRQYHIQYQELTDRRGKNWVIINIHLSAFDEDGNIRIKQFEELLVIADQFYQEGKYVVIGGDWNMQLTPTDFPTTTKEKYLFWLKVLPKEKLKPGWQLLFDAEVPTVRTNERPYNKGENYTTIIDGFLFLPM
ncbi:MAG: hypothetical protein JKX72_09165 [Robiginitomaculum sp.]|nr:hypothetical protein [Robiginitomaculum sp.]